VQLRIVHALQGGAVKSGCAARVKNTGDAAHGLARDGFGGIQVYKRVTRLVVSLLNG
jgi:hypothetical protein